jgi:hypothetical protein
MLKGDNRKIYKNHDKSCIVWNEDRKGGKNLRYKPSQQSESINTNA